MRRKGTAEKCPLQLYPYADELARERFEINLKETPSDFSYDYFKLTQSAHSVKEDGKPLRNYNNKRIKFPESFVCSLWMDQVFKSKYLFTEDHKRIEVLYPGQWNFEKGPDFKNARIRLEKGEIAKGDIEIHNFSSEWKAHGHHHNTEYNNVILHIFLYADKNRAEPKKANGQPLIQIELEPFLIKDVSELYSLMKLEEYPFQTVNNRGHCAEYLGKADEKRVLLFLNLAGEARLIAKADMFLRRLHNNNFDQLLYGGMMESLGFKYSKLQFAQIAKTVTLSYLRNNLKSLSQNERSIHIESILLGVAGFLDHFKSKLNDLDPEANSYFNQLWELWRLYEKDFITSKLHISRWSFSSVRPANYPYRRLAGISHFLAQNFDKDLLARAYPAVSVWSGDFPANKKKEFIANFFPQPENNFWALRYSPFGKTLSSPIKLIGEERISDMIINVFLPVLLSFAKQQNSQPMKKIIYEVYSRFPRLSSNRITRFMKEFILGLRKDKNNILNKAKRQQALHQIYADYCESNKSACNNCRFYFIAKYLIFGETAASS